MFERKKLLFDFSALEPNLDAKTMEIHSEKHHQAYTDKLNSAVENLETKYETAEEYLMMLDTLPEEIQKTVRNNGGGFVNHNMFFETISPKGGGEPIGKVAELINTLGGFAKFKQEFTDAAASVFGSGWAFLAVDEKGENPHIHSFQNQDNPYLHGHYPVLGIDVWEHAYYLHYQNRRPEYIEAFWNVLDWQKVEEFFSRQIEFIS